MRRTSIDASKIAEKSSTWTEFITTLSPLRSEQRGKAFEYLALYLLRIHPKYQTKLKHVWLGTELPSKIRKKLGLPVQDIGIDLVAETDTGAYWAIQCKYHHDPHKNITLNEIRSFLHTAHQVCRGKFSTLLVISSAHGYDPKMLLKYAPDVQYVLSDAFSTLNTEFFSGVRKLVKKHSPKLKPYKPKNHQRLAIEAAVQHFKQNRAASGKLIHPCGSGKSLTGYWIADALGANNVIVAVPSLQLVKQTLDVWTRESIAQSKAIEWLVVCSDTRIGSDSATHVQDLGVEVTTDSSEIARFLKKRRSGMRVLFTTYQSGKVTSMAARKAGITFDLGVFDEAHKTVGHKTGLFGLMLANEHIEIRRRLFMTATERRYQGTSDKILSMDDTEIYGETIDLMTFRDALEQKPAILSDYRVISTVVTRAEISELVDKNIFVKPDKGRWTDDTEARLLAATIALRKAMAKHKFTHAVSFHSSIAKARIFQNSQERFGVAYPGLCDFDCFHVSGQQSTADRQEEIDEFLGTKRALITNARCLTEGIDVPRIDAVLFADPKRSTVDIVQAVGRALRRSEGKKYGYVIIPVLIDEDDPKSTESAFQDILMTLRALASQDDRIIDYFRSVANGNRPSSSNRLIEIDIANATNVNLADFVSSVETQVWDRLAKLSWMPFSEAKIFVHKLCLKSQGDWHKYCRGQLQDKTVLPSDIPTNPQRTYARKGWKSWGDWLDNENVAFKHINWRDFQQARLYVQNLGLLSQAMWTDYCAGNLPGYAKMPKDIPKSPKLVYSEKGWVGMGDWLGTGTIAPGKKKYRPFQAACEFVNTLGLSGKSEWNKYCKGELSDRPALPNDIPADPRAVYKESGWTGYGEWLGTGNVRKGTENWRPFNEARQISRGLKLNGQSDWEKYCKDELPGKLPKPDDIPRAPHMTYNGKGWKSWGDWLGTGNVQTGTVWRPFEQAREFARGLSLTSSSEWIAYCKGDLPGKPMKPNDIPSDPRNIYQNIGWAGHGDWLGTGRVQYGSIKRRSFQGARQYARGLKLRSRAEWQKYCNGELNAKPPMPSDIPNSPSYLYKDCGWKGWSDFLGTERKRPKRCQD